MALDRTLLQNAEIDLRRYRLLVAQDSAPKQQLDTQAPTVRASSCVETPRVPRSVGVVCLHRCDIDALRQAAAAAQYCPSLRPKISETELSVSLRPGPRSGSSAGQPGRAPRGYLDGVVDQGLPAPRLDAV
jgi:hypothetical protein